jgi:DNA polymerase-3 subunit chi
VHIHAESREDAVNLDGLLWTFSDTSFLPHALAGADEDAPITIGWPGVVPEQADVLINLGTGVPEFADRFARILETVTAHSPLREQARERWRTYRGLGCELRSIEIDREP